MYDGRRNVLTVANVGDSMCVLSRGGRAVNMHRMHRLDDAEERARVEAAGGTVIKNRYGTLRYNTVYLYCTALLQQDDHYCLTIHIFDAACTNRWSYTFFAW